MGFKNTESEAPKCEIIEKLGKIGDKGLELRYISWNGKPAKYDLRPWYVDEDGTEKCRKGITLTGEELEALYNKLKEIDEEEYLENGEFDEPEEEGEEEENG